jgi:hypothetical protein
MADISPEFARLGNADQGIHIGPIQVNLPAVLMNNTANVANARFENAVGGGVGDHQGG